MDQSTQMLQLRIKLDVWSQGVNERIRNRNRELLEATYMRLPPCRILLYAQTVKLRILSHEAPGANMDEKLRNLKGKAGSEEPENIVAEDGFLLRSAVTYDHVVEGLYVLVHTDQTRSSRWHRHERMSGEVECASTELTRVL